MNIQELISLIRQKKSYLCVGLDTDISKLPAHLKDHKNAVVEFNKAIIDATKDYCAAYKINTAFYESQGVKGWEAMEETLHYIGNTHFTIADAKRGDIGNTSAQYAKAFFETLPFDSVTVAPYMGEDSIKPFLEYENKTTIVLGLTSNKGADDFELQKMEDGGKLYEKVLQKIASWATPQNLMFVIGATQAEELKHIRTLLPEHFFLVPGVGAQGGSLKEVSRYGLNKNCGLLINASRAVIFASDKEDFAEKAAEAAKNYHEEMQLYLS
ncbi:MAG: orotidine-5'-phosphate decarboxylase [Arachidicoccus sp.]|nr:orotidine-5'-phosphate decarboxylase [Arachidicoccus sp.]